MIFVHFLEKDKASTLTTYQVKLQRRDYSVKELIYCLQPYRPDIASPMSLHLTHDGPALSEEGLLGQMGVLNDGLFVIYEGVKPVASEVRELLHYVPLTKYSFEEGDQFVKVYVELKGASQAKAVHKRFLDKSIEIKLDGVEGKNYIFAVPNTQCKLNPATSKLVVKENRMIVYIGKVKKEDNWFSVYKAKTIGGDDD
jgi:hypothetical protein